MANRYANLVGSNKIKDEWTKINAGFDAVQADMDAKADADDLVSLENTVNDHIGAGGNAHAEATDQQAGFMSAADKAKLDGIEEGAEVNQNAFAQVNDVEADNPSDTVTIEGSTGITVTTNPAEKKVIITATGTSTPGPHGSSHTEHGADPIPNATTTEGGLMSATDKQMLESHASRHAAGGPDEITPVMIGAASQADFASHLNESVQDGVHGIATTQNITYYVSPTGDDNNDGLTPGTAFATVQKALNSIPKYLLHTAIIQILPGVYDQNFTIDGFKGPEPIVIIGDDSEPENVKFINNYLFDPIQIRCCNNVEIRGLYIEDTVKSNRRGINVEMCSKVYLRHLIIKNFGLGSYYAGVFATFSKVSLANCVINDCFSAITAGTIAEVYSSNNSGTGNNVGLFAQEGGTISKRDTQPTGTTNESTRWGGVIR